MMPDAALFFPVLVGGDAEQIAQIWIASLSSIRFTK